jgi:hypothetical protein
MHHFTSNRATARASPGASSPWLGVARKGAQGLVQGPRHGDARGRADGGRPRPIAFPGAPDRRMEGQPRAHAREAAALSSSPSPIESVRDGSHARHHRRDRERHGRQRGAGELRQRGPTTASSARATRSGAPTPPSFSAMLERHIQAPRHRRRPGGDARRGPRAPEGALPAGGDPPDDDARPPRGEHARPARARRGRRDRLRVGLRRELRPRGASWTASRAEPDAVPDIHPPERRAAADDRAPVRRPRASCRSRGTLLAFHALRPPSSRPRARHPVRRARSGDLAAGARARERPHVRLCGLAVARKGAAGSRAHATRREGDGQLGLAAWFDLLHGRTPFDGHDRAGVAPGARMA